jgi:FKBP-type peptidyl-prolyl cis-trans isomerase 2
MGVSLISIDNRGWNMNDETLCIGAAIVGILLVGGLAFLTWWDERDDDEDNKDEILLVKEGDEVSIDYTGRFLGAGGELGAIFDTSIPEDARNDSIPKALTFQEKDTYDDLTFTVGSGEMIKGFDEGVLGMTEGSVKYITVPPEMGYGESLPELVLNISSKKTIPLREEVPTEDFKKQYPLVDQKGQESFIHPFWGWEVKILEEDPASVILLHQPVYNEEYGNFNWNVTVTDISTSRNLITLNHNLNEIDEAEQVNFLDLTILYPEWAGTAREANNGQDPAPGRVQTVGGVITIDFNREVVGRTLVFKVIVNSIVR